MEMKKYKLGEICRIASARRIFENEYVAAGIPFIRGQEVSDGSLTNPKSKFQCYISKKRFEELKKEYGIPKKGDILITAVGTIGNLCYLDKDIDFYFKDGNLIWFSDFKEDILSEYLYFFMKGDYFKKQLNHTLIGAVQKALTMEKLSKIEIIVPPLPTQQKIAAVLSSLDKKIALNSRINARLEQMAKRLYEHYFVQFDFPTADGKPYKTSGGKMVYSSELKREIPEGWEVKRLGELNVVSRGTTITQKQTTKGNIKVVAGGLTYSYTNGESNRRKNCITVSGSGENAGFVNFWREPIFASDCSTVQFEDDFDTIICYFNLKMHEHIFFRNSHKSAQPHVYPSDIKEIPFVIPPKEVKEKIKDLFLKANDKIAILQQESARLTSLRDRLLPLLMNGQVSV